MVPALGQFLTTISAGGTFSIAIGTQGSENPGNATFIVTRSGVTTGTVTVDFAATSGTAISGTDFTATSGTLTFASGVTSQTITVPVLADTAFETTERFTVTLSDPGGGATISGSASIEGRIINDFTVANGQTPLSQLSTVEGYVFNGIDAVDQAGGAVAAGAGLSLSAAGDVNGDGISDIIIGARYADPNAITSGGEVYVVFGGTAKLAALDAADGTVDGSCVRSARAPGSY